jgi:mono/diheme cytochrome c family protein
MMAMTKSYCLHLRVALCAALIVGLGWTGSALPQTNTQTVASAASQPAFHGRQLYLSVNCYLCHGTVGQGGAGPTLAPPRLMPQSAFSAYVRHPNGHMPPYTDAVLSDSNLAAIYSYLESLPPPPSQLPKLLSENSAAGGD